MTHKPRTQANMLLLTAELILHGSQGQRSIQWKMFIPILILSASSWLMPSSVRSSVYGSHRLTNNWEKERRGGEEAVEGKGGSVCIPTVPLGKIWTSNKLLADDYGSQWYVYAPVRYGIRWGIKWSIVHCKYVEVGNHSALPNWVQLALAACY